MAGYKPNQSGLRELATSAKVAAACMSVAQQVAARANAKDPQGAYKPEAATVLVGKDNEPRSGARVSQTKYSSARNQALRQAIKK